MNKIELPEFPDHRFVVENNATLSRSSIWDVTVVTAEEGIWGPALVGFLAVIVRKDSTETNNGTADRNPADTPRQAAARAAAQDLRLT